MRGSAPASARTCKAPGVATSLPRGRGPIIVCPLAKDYPGCFGDDSCPLTEGSYVRVVLAGDAEKKSEEYMSNGSYTGPLTVLKVTHHGSNTSSTPLFLNSFKPEIAIIQVGTDNSYGHPTPQTLERLQKADAQVFRNDEHGDVVVTIDSEKTDVAVTKGA